MDHCDGICELRMVSHPIPCPSPAQVNLVWTASVNGRRMKEGEKKELLTSIRSGHQCHGLSKATYIVDCVDPPECVLWRIPWSSSITIVVKSAARSNVHKGYESQLLSGLCCLSLGPDMQCLAEVASLRNALVADQMDPAICTAHCRARGIVCFI
ncbi:uncharacterized protein EI97DRAFT_235905 [Westerdykella ornata]|uniref:Uncharacterized protein n=1 Tax=Westerdykella ornata TaxID=318751 RepID=A0A6A6J673_WESOR|nr:uncharacterized protein EI97DRAFT_235905 [Westerdykella ornata]KAF2272080.1 hypothetical protein EI97DRAFT_235905 [Westerdykella ornata]